MASEYFKWKYKDVKPDEVKELTPDEKRRNWWHYHKWHVVIGAVLLFVVLDIGKSALGIGEVKPDYQFAYVAANALPEDAANSLETALAAYGEDLNGDGKVVVQLNQYATAETDESSAEVIMQNKLQEELQEQTNSDSAQRAYYAQAAQVSLMADLESCDSFFFILKDAETFQKNFQILSRTDGTLPEEWDTDYNALSYRWEDCPVLNSLELGEYVETVAGTEVSGDVQSLLNGFSISRRGFWTETTCDNLEGCEALWNVLTEGAKQ